MAVLSNTGIRAGASAAGGGGYQIEKSVRFESDDAACLKRTPSSSGDRQKWTISFWFKDVDPENGENHYFSTYGTGDDGGYFRIWKGSGSMKISFWNYYAFQSFELFRDPSAWYHCVIAMDTTQATAADRCKMWMNGVQLSSNNSVATQNSEYGWNHNHISMIGNLTNTSGVASFDGNSIMAEIHSLDGTVLDASSFGETDSTTGVWVPKKYSGSAASYGTNGFYLKFTGSDLGEDFSGNDHDWTAVNLNSGIYSGTKPTYWTASALYVDSADVIANGTNRGQDSFTLTSEEFVYIIPNNGGSKGEKAHTSDFPSLVYVFASNDSAWVNTGSYGATDAHYFEWQDNTASYGDSYDYATNAAVYLISDTRTSSLPDSESKMTGTFPALVNIVGMSDTSTDTPTAFDDGGNGTGNYATWNPLDKGSGLVLSQGNLRIKSVTNDFVRATIGMTSGKWYYEETVGAGDHMMGIADWKADNTYYLGQSHTNGHVAFGWYKGNGAIYYYVDTDLYTVTTNSLGTYTTGDVVGVAFDADNGALYFSKNGTWVNSATKAEIAAGTTTNAVVTGCNAGPYFFAAGLDATTADHYANFGQRAWAYPDSVPDGFKALNTYNIADPTIKDPSKHFNTILYEGDPGVSNAITGVGFEPGLVWARNRDNANAHNIFDQVRGDTKVLYADYAVAEDPITTFEFTSDGFTTTSSDNGWNGDYNYTSWHWKAPTSSSPSAGSLNSSVYNVDDWVDATTTSNGAIWPGASLSTILNGQAGGSFHGDHNASPSYLLFEWDSGTIQGNVRLKLRTYGTAAHSYKDGSGSSVTINVPTLSTFDWYDLGNIDLTEYKGTCPSSGNAAAIEAIELNGKILVDSGQTPTDVPTIASTYKADADAGFSIVSWTGTGAAGTVAHGLNAKPKFIITKARTTATNWVTGHEDIGWTNFLFLDQSDTSGASAAVWNNTEPTSNVFSVSTSTYINADDVGIIGYCWSEVDGYSRFGNYRGNGTDGDGPFVWCGFRPMWILIKRTDTAANWVLFDSKINPYNEASNSFPVSSSGSETWITSDEIDILSNGFKLRSNDSIINGSTSAQYVFAAFAESPFKYANAR